MTTPPRIRPAVPREEFDELVERTANLEQALILTQSVLVEATERLDEIDAPFGFEEQPDLGPTEEDMANYEQDQVAAVGALTPAQQAEQEAFKRFKAAEAHEAAKRAASNQPTILDGQAFMPQQTDPELTPLTPEQIAQQANSTVEQPVPANPIEAANSSAAVPDEGIMVDPGREWQGPDTDIQRHYDDRGKPLG